MSRFDASFSAHLETLRDRRMLRRLRPVGQCAPGYLQLEGRTLLNVSSNDYLGLSRHPLLIGRAREWAECWGAGATASRLVCGSLEPFHRVEAKLARFKGTEAALVLASGWQANASVLAALADAGVLGAEPLVFTDRLNHASLHQGCLAAGVRQIRFRHNDLDHLESLLGRHAEHKARRFIVTESVFSMDGDRADLAALAALAERHGAFLYIDEAHATGVLGPRGAGLSATVPGRVDLAMGTFGKALGGFGAYVAGSRVMCELLVNRCSGFVYATALPPAVLGAIDAALDLVPDMEAERTHLQTQAERLRAAFGAAGIDTGASSTQIIPALVGDEAAALAASRALEEAGFLGVAIRPPTVPAGGARIRFALSATHSAAEIDSLIAAAVPILRPAPLISASQGATP